MISQGSLDWLSDYQLLKKDSFPLSSRSLQKIENWRSGDTGQETPRHLPVDMRDRTKQRFRSVAPWNKARRVSLEATQTRNLSSDSLKSCDGSKINCRNVVYMKHTSDSGQYPA
jgi:hypothetical protein